MGDVAFEVGMFLAQLHVERRHVVGFALVAFVHAIFLWIIAASLAPRTSSSPVHEIQLSLFKEGSETPPPLPIVSEPEILVVAPPEIVMEPDPSEMSPAAAPMSVVLAPRPDPAHLNTSPAPNGIGTNGSISLLMKILVLPNGTVGDALVLRSSGVERTDILATSYVKANWRFLPALLNGLAIRYWTTVSVSVVTEQ
jgi:protein TonB